MKISEIFIHNFRSISEAKISIENYSLLVGPNSVGKSNLMAALRVFYEKDLKFDEERDLPKFNPVDDECWIDIEYELLPEEISNLKDEYKQPKNKLKLRKYFKTKLKGKDGKLKNGIYGYIGDSVSDELWYGEGKVQKGKIGDLIFIDSISKLGDHTKLSGPSALRELLNDIVKKLVKSSPAFQQLLKGFDSFSKELKKEKTEDNKSLDGLEADINTEIKDLEAEFKLKINPPSEADIVKNLVTHKIKEPHLSEEIDADQLGAGFQRRLIYSLIRIAAKYLSTTKPSVKKEFSPNLTLILFEEPEAFLHPIQQWNLGRNLQKLSDQQGHQILCSTHSPYFVSLSVDRIPAIIKLSREKAETKFGQISRSDLEKVFLDNQKINAILSETKKGKPHEDDEKIEMETIKYILWLNAERCGAFFANKVLLVEGPTEKSLFNYFIDNNEIEMPRGGLFVLDCLGKFNIHRFMNLFGFLKIKHSVLYDHDGDHHEKLNKLIQESKNNYTDSIESFPKDLETFLGVEKEIPKEQKHRKPQAVMFKLKQNTIPSENLDALKKLFKDLIRNS